MRQTLTIPAAFAVGLMIGTVGLPANSAELLVVASSSLKITTQAGPTTSRS
jgi:hypothetical protein